MAALKDRRDNGVIPHLKCDVEMEFEGPNDAMMNKWAADVLRRLKPEMVEQLQ